MTPHIIFRLLAAAALAAFLSSCASLNVRTTDQALLDRMVRATVLVRSNGTMGSGVVVGRRIVITAGHVVASPDKNVQIVFDDGNMIPGTRVFLSRLPDVAMIRLSRDSPFPPAAVDCNKLPLDAPITIVGHPGPLRWFVAHGFAASRHKESGVERPQIILAVTAIPGTSGAPVFDAVGHVRGLIRSGVFRGGRQMIGYTFAVPSRVFCDIPVVRAQIARAS